MDLEYSFIEKLPNYSELRAVNGELIIGNKKSISIVGFDSMKEAEGTTYLDFKCEAASQYKSFLLQDKLALKKQGEPQYFITLAKYFNDEWIATFGSKTLIYEKDEPYAIFCSMDNVAKLGLIDISRFIFRHYKDQTNGHKKQFTYLIDEFQDNYDLTEREKQVVFYLIRGKTSKGIADRLKISKRTADFHIDNLKFKFHCTNKEHLIEKLITEGFLTLLPASIFNLKF